MSPGRTPICPLQAVQTHCPVQTPCHSMTPCTRGKTLLPLLPGSHAHPHSQMQGDSKAVYCVCWCMIQLHGGHEQQQYLSCCLAASAGLCSDGEECHTMIFGCQLSSTTSACSDNPLHEDGLILTEDNSSFVLCVSPRHKLDAKTCCFVVRLWNLCQPWQFELLCRCMQQQQQQAGAEGVRDATTAEAHSSVQQSASGAERTAARSDQQPRTGPWHTPGQHNSNSSCASAQNCGADTCLSDPESNGLLGDEALQCMCSAFGDWLDLTSSSQAYMIWLCSVFCTLKCEIHTH